MQRDLDLIREILLQMETHEHGFAPKIDIPGRTEEEIGFHIWLLGDASLVKVADVTTYGSGSPHAIPLHITWLGYEFLDAARSQTVWEAGKRLVMTKTGGLGFEVLKAY